MAKVITGRIVTPENVLIRELDGESVLLNLNSESYFGLDEIGTRMWGALTTTGSVSEALDLLLEEYSVDRSTLETDVFEFIEKLRSQGLIEVRDE
ncbi:MAG: PqqD family protein [Planctomycetes bacterium]|nr:PqqD family protein [Planctomycetota bacterium]